MDQANSKTLQGVTRNYEIIEVLGNNSDLRLSELTEKVELPKSTVYVHLETLVECGYVVKNDKKYRLSLQFLHHGGQLRNELDVYCYGRAEVQNLAEETGELVNLGVEENGRGVVIYMIKGDDAAVDLEPMGKYSYLHQAAYGRAILAHLSEDRIEQIIEQHGLPSETDYTIADREELFQELSKTRDRGYAIEQNEGDIGIGCIGVPVTDITGYPLGAVSITLPTRKLDSDDVERDLSQKLLNLANVIELKIGHS